MMILELPDGVAPLVQLCVLSQLHKVAEVSLNADIMHRRGDDDPLSSLNKHFTKEQLKEILNLSKFLGRYSDRQDDSRPLDRDASEALLKVARDIQKHMSQVSPERAQ